MKESNLDRYVINNPEIVLTDILGEKYTKYRSEWNNASRKEGVSDFPIHIDIDLMDYCNLECSYCTGKGDREWSHLILDKEVLIKILDESKINGLKSINFGLDAEPLVNKKLFKEYIKIVDKYHILDVFIHTNALNLDNEMRQEIFKHNITNISFSLGDIIDRGRRLDTIKHNIIEFRKLRDNLNKEIPCIRISIIPTIYNSDILQNTINFWKDYVDVIELQQLFTYNQIEEGYTKESFDCHDPWRRLSITTNGDIYPCCSSIYTRKDVLIGNIKNMTLKDAWNSDKMKSIRENVSVYNGCKICLNSYYSLSV